MRGFNEFTGIEKEAATRWKKEFGNLNQQNRDLIKNKVAKSSKEMTKGINQGNKALIERMGANVVSNHSRWAMKKHLKEDFGLSAKDSRSVARKLRQNKMLTYGVPGTNTPPLVVGFKKKLFGDGYKVTSPTIKRMFYKKDADLGRMTRSERKITNSILLRHELDEARSGKKPKTSPSAPYYSHFAPDVIHRESANVALAPDRVKKRFTAVRKERPLLENYPRPFQSLYKKIMGGTPYAGGEVENFARHGMEYGNSPYFNKKKANAHNKLNGPENLRGIEDTAPVRFK